MAWTIRIVPKSKAEPLLTSTQTNLDSEAQKQVLSLSNLRQQHQLPSSSLLPPPSPRPTTLGPRNERLQLAQGIGPAGSVIGCPHGIQLFLGRDSALRQALHTPASRKKGVQGQTFEQWKAREIPRSGGSADTEIHGGLIPSSSEKTIVIQPVLLPSSNIDEVTDAVPSSPGSVDSHARRLSSICPLLAELCRRFFSPVGVEVRPVRDASKMRTLDVQALSAAAKDHWRSQCLDSSLCLEWAERRLILNEPSNVVLMVLVSASPIVGLRVSSRKACLLPIGPSIESRAGVNSLAAFSELGRSMCQLVCYRLAGLWPCPFYHCLMNPLCSSSDGDGCSTAASCTTNDGCACGASSEDLCRIGFSGGDSTPSHLCPVCLRKLHYALRFVPDQRFEQLAEFWADMREETQSLWYRTAVARLHAHDAVSKAVSLCIRRIRGRTPENRPPTNDTVSRAGKVGKATIPFMDKSRAGHLKDIVLQPGQDGGQPLTAQQRQILVLREKRRRERLKKLQNMTPDEKDAYERAKRVNLESEKANHQKLLNYTRSVIVPGKSCTSFDWHEFDMIWRQGEKDRIRREREEKERQRSLKLERQQSLMPTSADIAAEKEHKQRIETEAKTRSLMAGLGKLLGNVETTTEPKEEDAKRNDSFPRKTTLTIQTSLKSLIPTAREPASGSPISPPVQGTRIAEAPVAAMRPLASKALAALPFRATSERKELERIALLTDTNFASVEKVKRMFDRVDSDRNGRIDPSEFVGLVQTVMGINTPGNVLMRNKYVKKHSIRSRTFHRYAARIGFGHARRMEHFFWPPKLWPQCRISLISKFFGNGQVLYRNGLLDVPAKRIQDFWAMIDGDGDGQITFEEFVRFTARQFDGALARSKTLADPHGFRYMSMLDTVGRCQPWHADLSLRQHSLLQFLVMKPGFHQPGSHKKPKPPPGAEKSKRYIPSPKPQPLSAAVILAPSPKGRASPFRRSATIVAGSQLLGESEDDNDEEEKKHQEQAAKDEKKEQSSESEEVSYQEQQRRRQMREQKSQGLLSIGQATPRNVANPSWLKKRMFLRAGVNIMGLGRSKHRARTLGGASGRKSEIVLDRSGLLDSIDDAEGFRPLRAVKQGKIEFARRQ